MFIFAFVMISIANAEAERPQKRLLDRKVERVLNQDSPGTWRSAVLSLNSIVDIIEELYFKDNGAILSSFTLEERRQVVKKYIGVDAYNSLKAQALDGFLTEQSISKKMDMALFMAGILFDESLVEKVNASYFKLNSRDRDTYVWALGYCKNQDVRDVLETQIQNGIGARLRFLAELNVKGKLYEFENKDLQHNLYRVCDEIVNEKEKLINSSEKEGIDAWDRLRVLQATRALRFSGSSDLIFIVASSGLEEDPMIALEVLKYAVSMHREAFFVEAILDKYSKLDRDLDAYEEELLRWACVVIDKRQEAYRQNNDITTYLKRLLSKNKGPWTEFASQALDHLINREQKVRPPNSSF